MLIILKKRVQIDNEIKREIVYISSLLFYYIQLLKMLLFLFLVLFFFYFFSFCSMTLDVIPQESGVCVYSCPMEGKCPCVPKSPEPSPEVLEENQHQKEIRNISRSTQKLVYELQHAKMKLAVLKLTQEIDQLSSTAPLKHKSEEGLNHIKEEEEPIIEEVFEKSY